MASANQVSQLFVALYNRAIDGGTASQYASRAYNQGLISDIINLNSSFVNYSNQMFVEMLYKNALGKDQSNDAAGIKYWVDQATNNGWTKAQLVDNFLRNVEAWKAPQSMRDAEGNIYSQAEQDLAASGLRVFNAKVGIAEKAATTIGGNVAATTLTFGNGLPEITTSNFSTEYEKAINETVEAIAARNPLRKSGGETVTLSADQQNFVERPASGADTKLKYATDNDDTITATVAASGGTFSGGTIIDAGAGYDTLKLSMSSDFSGGFTGSGGISNVERVELTNVTGVANQSVTFDAAGINGVTTYSLNGLNGVNLTNIAFEDYLLIEMNNVKNAASSGGQAIDGGQTRIDFTQTPAGGNLFLNLNGVGYNSNDVTRQNHEVSLGYGIGVLNISLSGNNFVDFKADNDGIRELTVGGNGTLNTNLAQGITYFNAAAATGDLIIKAQDVASRGQNGNNVFTHFSTGTGNDQVTLNVSRLAQTAQVDLGGGNDTLTLMGDVDLVARQNYYNFNTIENLVFATSGNPLLLDLGTKIETLPEPSGSGSQTESGSNTPITNITADRSANLQTITFENGANVQLTGLGEKNLAVDYNGTGAGQKVLVDTSGIVNLELGGRETLDANGNGTGSGAEGGGFINLSNAPSVNINLTGQGFAGYLSAGKATDIVINNTTGNKKLQLNANTLTEKNDLSSVENITINTEAQNGGADVSSINLAAATLPQLKNVVFNGIGDITFGDVDTRNNLDFNGSNYSGRLVLGNISAKKPGVGSVNGIYGGEGILNITTKGAISTGTLTGNQITINLRNNIETNAGAKNNDIGTIFVDGDNGSLTYITGTSGTAGTRIDENGVLKDTQDIVVNTNIATLNLDGVTGVDKFNITASNLTKNLTINGSLGAANPDQIINGNFDSVRIDLSNTTGAVLNIANLELYNPDGGVIINPSKGQDTISLSNNISEVIEFTAGGYSNIAGTSEVYTFDLGKMVRLGNQQSITLDGLTITNISGKSGVSGGIKILTAELITKVIAAVANSKTGTLGSSDTFTAAELGQTGTATTKMSDLVSVTGEFSSLVGEWAGAKVANDGTKLTFTAANKGNLTDLDLTFSGTTGTGDSPVDISGAYTEAASAKDATVQVSATNTAAASAATLSIAASTASTAPTTTFTFNLDGQEMKVNVTAKTSTSGGTSLGATTTQSFFKDFFTTGKLGTISATATTGVTAVTIQLPGDSSAKAYAASQASTYVEAFKLPSAYKYDLSSAAKLSVAMGGTASAYTKTTESVSFSVAIGSAAATTFYGAAYSPAQTGQLVVDFGSGLLAGQSYTFNNKTVIATQNLTGAEVAEAFLYNAGDAFDGAVIVGEFKSGSDTLIDMTKVDYGINGSVLTFIAADRSATTASNAGFHDDTSSEITGTGAMAVNTKGASGLTTTQGLAPQESQPAADSYVVFTKADYGTAGTSTGDTGRVADFVINSSNLDTISNFDVVNDKLQLNKFDPAVVGNKGLKYGYNDIAGMSGTETLLGSGGVAGQPVIHLDTAGSTLAASVTNGIIDFSVVNANGTTTGADAISLEAKLFVATTLLAEEKVAGFYHNDGTNNDFYVVGTGTNTGNNTQDDLVVKLTGVSPTIQDIATILA